MFFYLIHIIPHSSTMSSRQRNVRTTSIGLLVYTVFHGLMYSETINNNFNSIAIIKPYFWYILLIDFVIFMLLYQFKNGTMIFSDLPTGSPDSLPNNIYYPPDPRINPRIIHYPPQQNTQLSVSVPSKPDIIIPDYSSQEQKIESNETINKSDKNVKKKTNSKVDDQEQDEEQDENENENENENEDDVFSHRGSSTSEEDDDKEKNKKTTKKSKKNKKKKPDITRSKKKTNLQQKVYEEEEEEVHELIKKNLNNK
jgi:hypothetical protein